MIAFAMVVAAALASAADDDPLPAELAGVYPVDDHQLVVFRDCGGEYCRDTFHLRRVELNGMYETMCRAPIAELNRMPGRVLIGAEAVDDGRALRLRLDAAGAAHRPEVRLLRTSGNCHYRLSK